jgi:ribonucleoside-diphosphate reductase beta chain
VPEEIDITKDRQDYKVASPSGRHAFSSNLLRQTVLDSLQGKAPLQVFGPVASLPELESLFSIWGMFETNLHSNSYSHIIRGVWTNPAELFDKVHEIQQVVDMAASIGHYYDTLGRFNELKSLGEEVPLYEHKKAIYMALHASYALEAIRFMVSFATSFAMMENKIFIGNGTIIGMILQDEMLHTEWTAYILNQVCKEDKDFSDIRDEMRDQVIQLYKDVISEEKGWAQYLFKEGPIIGLNTKILDQFVDWTAKEKLADIGIKY